MRAPRSSGSVSMRNDTIVLEAEYNGRRYRSRAAVASDLSIPLTFDGTGPCAFGGEPARLHPLATPGFSGRVTDGASCNASVLTVTPHANGTHTESIAHLVDRGPTVPALLLSGWLPAWLASVDAANGAVTPPALADVLPRASGAGCIALVLRTRPNDMSKLTRRYTPDAPPAWLAAETARAIAAAGIEHLVVDLPSLDRLDDPALGAHRAFFGLHADGSRDGARRRCTVTEFAYVPDELADGLYLLDIQVPRWQLEAVPSRVLAVPAELLEERS